MKRWAVVWVCCLWVFSFACPGAAPTGPTGDEQCANGLDDNGDGKIDCDDPTCAHAAECSKVPENVDAGKPCSRQADCLVNGWAMDDPLQQCLLGHCKFPDAGVDVRFEIDTVAYVGQTYPIKTFNTRFILRAALNGTVASCSEIEQMVGTGAAAKADTIETSGRYNLLAFDVSSNSNVSSNISTIPFFSVATGKDFLVWVEAWAGPKDPATKLPTGQQIGFGCFDNIAEIKPDPTRVIRVQLP